MTVVTTDNPALVVRLRVPGTISVGVAPLPGAAAVRLAVADPVGVAGITVGVAGSRGLPGENADFPAGGTAGQLLARAESAAIEWVDPPSALPAGGAVGQVLTRTDGGAAWGDLPLSFGIDGGNATTPR